MKPTKPIDRKKEAAAVGKLGREAKPIKTVVPDTPFRKVQQLTVKNGKPTPIK